MARSPSKRTRFPSGRAARNRTWSDRAYHQPKVREPDLVMLFAEPEVRLLMRADHVDERELRAMLDAVAVQLRNYRNESGTTGQGSKATDVNGVGSVKYRSGVGIVLLNQKTEVFVGRRADVKEDAWQMPQGGIDLEETPKQAALRELKEEIGTDKVAILAESERWLYYDVPPELAQKAWGRQWQGQRQKWFVMLFRGQDSDIDLRTSNPEFNAWRWVSLQELSALAVYFKRQLYLNVLGKFATLFRD